MANASKLTDGKIAIVTGAGGGIGRQHALALAKAGAKVVVNDLGGSRDGAGAGSEMADRVVDEIRALGAEAIANYDSVATVAGGQALAKAALSAFGRIDILVNNAGILRDKSFAKMDEAAWDSVIAVHLKGAFCVTQPVFQHMKERGDGGAIINTSSTSGLLGNFGQANYGAAKAGIAGFTRCLAIEGERAGIRVNAIVPIAFTRMTSDLPIFGGQNKEAEIGPQFISPMVVYLASDAAKKLNGRFFFLSGGQIKEMRVVMNEGATKTADAGLWTAEEIAANIERILA